MPAGERAVVIFSAVGVSVVAIAMIVLAIVSLGTGKGTVAMLAALVFSAWLVWIAIGPDGALLGQFDSLLAGPAGVGAGPGGRKRYAWSEIDRFEFVPRQGFSAPRGIMHLHDGRRIVLRALREEVDEFGAPRGHATVERGVGTLSHMLREATGARS